MIKIKIFAILIFNFNVVLATAQSCKVANVDLTCLNGLWQTVLSDSSIKELTLFEKNKFIKFTYTHQKDSSYVKITQGFLGYLDYDLQFGDTIDIRELKLKGITFVAGNLPSKSYFTNRYSCNVMDIYCDEESYEQGAAVCDKKNFISKEIYNLILQKGISDKHDYINEWALYKYIPFRKVAFDNVEILNEDLTPTRIFLKKNSQIEIIQEQLSVYKIIYRGNKTNVGWIKKTNVTY